MSFVSGPYTWTYNGWSLGVLADAPRLRFGFTAEEIRGDNLGEAIQGLINRGGSMYLDLIFQEWDLRAVQEVIWPFLAYQGNLSHLGFMGTAIAAEAGYPAIGCPMAGKPLIATATASSCASPKTFTFTNALLAPQTDVAWLMGSTLRNVPVSMLIIPRISPAEVGGQTNPRAGYLEYFSVA